MSNKTYTAAEVEALLAAERAKSKKTSNATVEIRKATRINKTSQTPYTGIFVEGPFRPCYIPLSVATALLANVEALKAAVDGPAKDESKALSSDTAPRLAAKS